MLAILHPGILDTVFKMFAYFQIYRIFRIPKYVDIASLHGIFGCLLQGILGYC